jgi:DNA-binding MarR family transcriptional regulator
MRKVSSRNQSVIEFWLRLQNFLDVRRRAARAVGIAPSEYEVMLTLMALSDSDPNISTIGKRLLVQHRAAARVVKRLARHGLLRAQRSDRDRRSVILRLTPKGERVLNRLAATSIAGLSTEGPRLVSSLRELEN